MKNDNEIKRRVTDTARELFSAYGYSKVSMDDLAAKLGMSKKTFYNHFSSKEDLLLNVVIQFEKEVETELQNILKEHLIFEEKAHKILSYAGTKVSSINPYFLEDIRRNAPEVWSQIQQIKTNTIFELGSELLKEGIKKGFIKKDINKTLTIMLYASAIETILTPDFTKQIPGSLMKDMPYSPKAVFEGLVDIIFKGILTKK